MRFKAKNIFISIFISLFLFQSVYASIFVDVVERSLFFDAVTYFSNEVPILDTSRERFKPLDKVTKAEFFKLLVRGGGFQETTEIFNVPFYDVTSEDWFAQYINKALELNVVEFNEFDPNFNPGHTVNRIEALKWILKFYSIDPQIADNFPLDYTDVSPVSPDANVAKIAYQLQLLHDYKTKELNPSKELTRAEAIHIFYQIHRNDIDISYEVQTQNNEDVFNNYDADFALFFEVWNKVTSEYIEQGDIDETELLYGAIAGLVDGLNDPYSQFFEPLDAAEYKEVLEGAFEGIGIYLTQEDRKFIIITPLKGSPAEEAGILPNDELVEIDETTVLGLEMEDIIELLRGVSGTSVKLKIKRNGLYKILNIIRSQINIPYVESDMINGVGIIYYYQFTSNSHQQFLIEIEKLIAENPKGLVIDFRNNPGGYLYSAQQLISRFIPTSDVYVTLELATGTKYSEKSLGPGDLKDFPIVILINGGSASSSEIAALALKDQLDAKIVGASSFGKAKIQEIINYSDGSSLKLSIARWTSPNGTSVDDIGIIPDYNVILSESDIQYGNDTQLEKAIELIN